jgi:transcriptional regulator with GAF, ATPase, and Fis domain
VARDRTADTASTAGSAWVSPDGAVLHVLSGDAKGDSFRAPARVGAKVRVGKSSDNDLALSDKTVSRHHAEVVRTEKGLLLRDLGSRNGTFVGGVRVREADIEPGSIVLFGDVQVLVRVDLEGAVVPPSASASFEAAIGQSLSMRRIFGLLERIAPTDATVLLTGETGTGKDVLARSIHAASKRRAAPFEVVDCGAIAVNLIESELFGHEKGAFTGAASTHLGAFERAHGGTIFLDEIGELPLAVQPKLLRVLDARHLRRVGGSRVIDVDVRVIAATTRDLLAESTAGSFRQDLYFRLAVVPAHVPALRERAEDIAPLSDHLLSKSGASGVSLAPAALAQLRSHEWPGNVRELRNVLERALFLAHSSGEKVIQSVALAPPKREAVEGDVFVFEEGVTYRDARARAEAAFERRFVTWILQKNGGNIAAAAREAKMDRKYLGDLVRKHGLSTG